MNGGDILWYSYTPWDRTEKEANWPHLFAQRPRRQDPLTCTAYSPGHSYCSCGRDKWGRGHCPGSESLPRAQINLGKQVCSFSLEPQYSPLDEPLET